MIHKCPGFIKGDSVVKSCITQMKHKMSDWQWVEDRTLRIWTTSVTLDGNAVLINGVTCCDSKDFNNQHYYRYELKQVQIKYQRNWNILQNKIWRKLEHIFLVWYIQKTIIINDVWFSKYISQPCFTLLTLFWEKKTIRNCLNNWFYISFQTLVKAIFELLN